MNKTLSSLLFSSILLAAPSPLHAQYHSQVWNPDNGNGTYTNPVIYADYSDPDVVAVGEDYYLTASTSRMQATCSPCDKASGLAPRWDL